MKNTKFLLLIFAFLFLINFCSARDCWEIEKNQCSYIDLNDCVSGYYSEYTDCERDLAISQIDTRNFVQKTIEHYYPDLDFSNNKIIQIVYEQSNVYILIYSVFLITFGWIIINARRKR